MIIWIYINQSYIMMNLNSELLYKVRRARKLHELHYTSIMFLNVYV